MLSLVEKKVHQSHSVTTELATTMTCLGRDAHWCSSGMNVIGTTKHLLIGFKVHSIKLSLYKALLRGTGTCYSIGHGPMRKCIPIILLMATISK